MRDIGNGRENIGQSSGRSDIPTEERSRLGQDIEAAKRRLAEHEAKPDALIASASSASAMAFGVRLSSAFVGAILAGAIIGWLADHFFAVSPWGLVTGLIVGFIIGFFNLLRVLRQTSSARSRG